MPGGRGPGGPHDGPGGPHRGPGGPLGGPGGPHRGGPGHRPPPRRRHHTEVRITDRLCHTEAVLLQLLE